MSNREKSEHPHISKPSAAEYANETYSPKSDKVAAWLAVLFGYFGFLDFYTEHPIKGIAKILLTITLVGFIVAELWTLYDLFLISKGKYLDGNNLVIKQESNDALVLFCAGIIAFILGTVFEVYVIISVVSFLRDVLESFSNAAPAIGDAATAVSGAANSVAGAADAVTSTVNSYESTTILKKLLYWLSSFIK